MRETPGKKKRAPNYTHREKSLLLEVTVDFRHVIDNKKTDSKSIKEKEIAWDRIAKIFNFRSRENIRRSSKSLRKLYENLRNIRKPKIPSQGTKNEEYKLEDNEVSLEMEDEASKDAILGIIRQPSFGINNQQFGNSQGTIDSKFLPESPSSSQFQDDEVPGKLEHNYYALKENEEDSDEEEIYNEYTRNKTLPKRSISEEYNDLATIKIALHEKEIESIERSMSREEELHELKKTKMLLEIRKTELEIKKLTE